MVLSEGGGGMRDLMLYQNTKLALECLGQAAGDGTDEAQGENDIAAGRE